MAFELMYRSCFAMLYGFLQMLNEGKLLASTLTKRFSRAFLLANDRVSTELKVETPTKVSEKVAFFQPSLQKKHIVFQPYHEFRYEISAFENAV